jgi:hypothetical protein
MPENFRQTRTAATEIHLVSHLRTQIYLLLFFTLAKTKNLQKAPNSAGLESESIACFTHGENAYKTAVCSVLGIFRYENFLLKFPEKNP